MEKNTSSGNPQYSKANRALLISLLNEKDKELSSLKAKLFFEKKKIIALTNLAESLDPQAFIEKILQGFPITKHGFVRCIQDANDFFDEKITTYSGLDAGEYAYLDDQVNQQLGGKNILILGDVSKSHYFSFRSGKKYPRSILALPFIRYEKKVGLIWFGDTALEAFDQEKISLLQESVKEYQLAFQLFSQFLDHRQAISTYDVVFDSIDFPILLKNKEKGIQFANKAAVSLFKLERGPNGSYISTNDQFAALDWENATITLPLEKEKFIAKKQKVLNSGDTVLEYFRFINQTNQERTGQYQETIMEVLCLFLEREVEKITGSVSVAKGLGNLSAKQEQYLQNVDKIIQTIKNKVRDLVVINHLNEDGFVKIEDVNIENVLNSVIEIFQPLLEQKHISIDKSGVRAENILILSDENLLHHLFLNTFESAIHDSPLGANINLSTNIDGQNFIFSIKDFGRGISSPDIDAFMSGKEFGPAFSNLLVAKSISELLLGNIEIISQIGRGKEVVISLPKN